MAQEQCLPVQTGCSRAHREPRVQKGGGGGGSTIAETSSTTVRGIPRDPTCSEEKGRGEGGKDCGRG